MAEGWARRFKTDCIEPYSAGIEPHTLDPRAITVMAEASVDISRHRSKHINELNNVQFDYVVTVCGHANENCPLFPGKTKVTHMGFDDPSALAENAKSPEEALNIYRRIRDQIKDFILTLPGSLTDGKDT
jgi:arsenate reductase